MILIYLLKNKNKMTIIAAKQFWKTNEEKKWTLFTDDCVTIGQAQVSAARKYRPKLREITWKNYDLIIASCGGTREIDLTLNLLEAKLEITKVKNTNLQWQYLRLVVCS